MTLYFTLMICVFHYDRVINSHSLIHSFVHSSIQTFAQVSPYTPHFTGLLSVLIIRPR